MKKKIFYKKEKNIKRKNLEEKNTLKKGKMEDKYKVQNINETSTNIIKADKRKKVTEEIIKIIEKRPDLLENLDIKKLEVIDQYYKDKIIEYKKKIASS